LEKSLTKRVQGGGHPLGRKIHNSSLIAHDSLLKMADEIKYETVEDLPPMTVSTGCMLINKTGGWRSVRPVIDTEECTSCMVCWKFCPDACIIILKEKPVIDLDYCKGCGICAEECPRGAITLVIEEK